MFYGVTRYSLFSPGSPSWKTSRSGVFKTPEEYQSYLFSEQRLQMRADVFFGKSVPALAAMAENHNYKHFVLYSELLPERHKQLLFAAAREYAFLVPVEWNKPVRGTGIEEVTPLIEEELAVKFAGEDATQAVAWFRLDDDDVLAADYLSCLAKYRTTNHIGMAVSFGLGLTAYRGEHELVNLREFYHPKSAQGMAFVSAFEPGQGRFTADKPGHHHKVDTVMPTILDSRDHMFFQIRHGDQDSTLNATPHERIAESLARLEKLPMVRAAEISRQKWPSLIDDIVAGESEIHELSTAGAKPLRLAEDTVLTFPVQAEAGLIEFEFQFESTANLLGGFAEVSYDLQGADHLDASTLGLKRHSKFGLSRQAWSRKSHGVVRHNILLPEGASISGITLRGKNRQPADVFIRMRKPRVIAVQAVN